MVGWETVNREVCMWGGEVQTKLSFFLSIVQHTSTQRKKPATRGMANQQLWTFERICRFIADAKRESADLGVAVNSHFGSL